VWLILNPPKLRNQKLQKERSNMQSRTTLAIHKWQSLFVKQVLWLCIRIKSVLFWQCNYVSEKSWTKHWQDAQAQSLNSYFHSKSPVMEKLLQEIMMMIPRLPTHWLVIGTSSMQYSLPLVLRSHPPTIFLHATKYFRQTRHPKLCCSPLLLCTPGEMPISTVNISLHLIIAD